VTHTVRLSVKQAAEADVYRDIARIPEPHRKDRRGQTIAEGSVCKLSSSGKSVYVLLRGKGETEEAAIWMDERTRNKLGVSTGQEVDFDLSTVGWKGQFLWAWSASDPAYRITARLALISVILGCLGFILGVVSLFLSGRT